ncbi:MAG: hypothetical protein D6733_07510 [Methanobacteriota archaeon]|nr:MAG: hypothetical protein D6733_07510 [Euryarchaeota archaeon]
MGSEGRLWHGALLALSALLVCAGAFAGWAVAAPGHGGHGSGHDAYYIVITPLPNGKWICHPMSESAYLALKEKDKLDPDAYYLKTTKPVSEFQDAFGITDSPEAKIMELQQIDDEIIIETQPKPAPPQPSAPRTGWGWRR